MKINPTLHKYLRGTEPEPVCEDSAFQVIDRLHDIISPDSSVIEDHRFWRRMNDDLLNGGKLLIVEDHGDTQVIRLQK